MSESKLRSQLSAARVIQQKVVEALNSSSPLPLELTDYLREIVSYEKEIQRAEAALDARATVWRLLVDFEKSLGPPDTDPLRADVTFGQLRINADQARFLLTQSYLATTWTAADALTGAFGRIICLESKAQNAGHPAKLWEDVVQDKKANTSAPLFRMARDCFGWPVALSYAFRNRFIHDGEGLPPDIFKGPAAVATFCVSDNGWDWITRKVKEQYHVIESQTRAPEVWPWPKDDLRDVLDICHREMDDLLAVLVAAACATLEAQVKYLLSPS